MKKSAQWRNSAALYAAMLAPVAALAVYAKIVIAEAWTRADQGATLAGTIATATEASALAHELQKERGMSAGFVGSNGAQFGAQLAEQRALTDAVLGRVRGRVLGGEGARGAQRTSALTTFFSGLDTRRDAVDALAITVPALAGEYTAAIRHLLSVADDPLLTGLHGRMARLNAVYGDVLMAKEFAGVERAMGSVGFGSGAFSTDVFVRYANLQSRQRYLLERAGALAEPEHAALLRRAEESAAAMRLAALRDIARSSLDTGDLGGVTGPEWFQASTAWLGELTQISNAIADDIRSAALATAEAQRTGKWTYVAIALAAAAVCLWFGLRYAVSLVATMRGVRGAITRIERGDAAVEVPGGHRKDDLGEIARALDAIRDQGAGMARVRAALDRTQTALLVLDQDGKPLYDNAAFRKLAVASELVGEDDATELLAVIDAGSPVLSGRDAREVHLGDRIFVARSGDVLNGEGEVLGAVIELDDVTHIRTLEREVTDVLGAVRDGDFSLRVTAIDNLGFTSFVATGLNQMIDDVSGFMARLNETLGALGQGDLSQRLTVEMRGDYNVAKGHVNGAIEQLHKVMRDVVEVAEQVERSAEPILDGAHGLAERAESQASTLEQTAATMEQISASIAANADSARASTARAERASVGAAEGAAIASDAVTAMERIEGGSARIGEIITVIESIAFQTNLLALNAAVEAARAGDAGRGFAVVASEVRALAQRSSDAAKDITQLIEQSTSEVGAGVDLVRRAGASLNEIVESVRDVTQAIEGISVTSAEQSSSVAEITSSVSAMDEMTQRNAALSRESASAAQTFAAHARELRSLVSTFTLESAEAKLVRQAR